MTPVAFPEANTDFNPPAGFEPSQVAPVRAFSGNVVGGSVDGMPVVVTAWMPSPEDIAALAAGRPLYVSIIGGFLPPHMVTTDFAAATQPS